MEVASLYRRVLPTPPAVEFASPEGRRLFAEALEGGTMEGFFSLVPHFQTQSEPAFCGLASIAVVLNALAIDPGRRWKGPWRWFDESMLDCCEPLHVVRSQGITFGKVVCLARCAGASVRCFRADHAAVHDLRAHLARCASSRDCHLIASYHRGHFKQTGGGHFSPIGGYHAGTDMALILDVARFKYPPHWVPLTLLWEAMNTTDKTTGFPRGFMLVSRQTSAPSLLYTVSCGDESWKSMAKYCVEDAPNLLKDESPDNVTTLLSRLVGSLPANAGDLIKCVVEVRRKDDGGSCLSKEEKERLLLKVSFLFLLLMLMYCCAVAPFRNTPYTLLIYFQETVVQQVRDTKLFRIVQELQYPKRLRQAHTKNVISGTVVSEGNRQANGVDLLLPATPSEKTLCSPNSTNEAVKYPSSTDVLTVLLLVLHPGTWFGIRDERVKAEFQSLVSTESLPDLLKRE
uniref:glutathione gamma-glutamylcysteinyltransferase n=1 Tax=Aegilops tauschii subsp. strangulata TaxID=200361 RepID=A0A453J7E6_AEGTS